MWSGKKRQQPSGPLEPAFLLFCPVALLVMHSWAILGGSYVNARVCFWLGGTKSTLYKCTLKQLPLLPTAAPTQTSDYAAARLTYWWWERWMWTISKCVSCYDTCKVWRNIPGQERFEKHYKSMEFYFVIKWLAAQKELVTHTNGLPMNGSKLLQSIFCMIK